MAEEMKAWRPQKLPGMEPGSLKEIRQNFQEPRGVEDSSHIKVSETSMEQGGEDRLASIADEHIKKMEEGRDVYFGVNFTPEEKRLLVAVIGNRIRIAKFYLEIASTSDIGRMMDNYRYGNSSAGLAGDGKFRLPIEESLFKNMVMKIAEALKTDESIIPKINELLGNILKQESQEDKFIKKIKSTKQKKRSKQGKITERQVEQIIDKQRVRETLRKEITNILKRDDSFLEELNKDDDSSMEDEFIRVVVKKITGEKAFSDKERQNLVLAAKNLLWTVISEEITKNN